jgi:hypothetical protein
MKRLLIVFAVIALMIGLTACDGDGEGSRIDEKAILIEEVL